MILKPNKPWIQFLVIGLLLWFILRLILLGFEKGDILIFIFPIFFFLPLIAYYLFATNKDFRTYEVSDNLKVKGFFWGTFEIQFREIIDFKTKEGKSTSGGIIPHDAYALVIKVLPQRLFLIYYDNYPFGKAEEFIRILESKGVKYNGLEKFSLKKVFQDLFKFKIFG